MVFSDIIFIMLNLQSGFFRTLHLQVMSVFLSSVNHRINKQGSQIVPNTTTFLNSKYNKTKTQNITKLLSLIAPNVRLLS